MRGAEWNCRLVRLLGGGRRVESMIFRETSTGRHLMVVYGEIDADTIDPVTAYDVPRRKRS